MIDEQTQDLVTQYVLGELDSAKAEQLRTQIESNDELKKFVFEMEETLGSLAYAARPIAAPADIPQRILRVEGRSAQVAPQAPESKRSGFNFIPWALAVCLAIACIFLVLDRERVSDGYSKELNGYSKELAALRKTNAQTTDALAQLQQKSAASEKEIGSFRDKTADLEKQLAAIQQKNAEAETELAAVKQKAAASEQAVAELTQKDADSQKELADLKQRNLLSEVKIATLKAQVAKFQQASAVVIWDPVQRSGILELDKLPPPAPGKDYQLWVVDPSNPIPVSAGVLSIPSVGLIRTSFHPAQPVQSAAAFAISVEKSGGSTKPEGQIILIGK
jgi:anti-sigma-K factor RskA